LDTNKSVINISKQTWKMYLSFAGILVSVCIMFYDIMYIKTGRLDLLGLAGVICSAIFACQSIRCPQCGLSWVWHAVTKKNINEWLPCLISLQECPNCGFPAEKKP